jgi:hypothetical protein
MTLVVSQSFPTRASSRGEGRTVVAPRLAQGLILAAAAIGAVGGALATDGATAAAAAAHAGPGLTRLLRGMAAIKALMALGAGGAVLWRLGAPADPWRLAAYALACAAMAAGPGLIWAIAPVAAGATALHAGLALCLILLWRDPAVSCRLSALIAARRARIS